MINAKEANQAVKRAEEMQKEAIKNGYFDDNGRIEITACTPNFVISYKFDFEPQWHTIAGCEDLEEACFAMVEKYNRKAKKQLEIESY